MVQMGGVRLRTELDRVPLWAGRHVSIKQLTEYMARYLYLPRLKDEQVLLAAIQECVASLAWQTDTFAYAEGWDESRKRYLGLRAVSAGRVVVDDRSLLVKPEAAVEQFSAEEQASAQGTPLAPSAGVGASPSPITSGTSGAAAKAVGPVPVAKKLSRFHATVLVDPLRLGRDAARIAEEVVQHLTGQVGSQVEITIEISADLADGAIEKVVRDVTENCRTLKFTDFGFEES